MNPKNQIRPSNLRRLRDSAGVSLVSALIGTAVVGGVAMGGVALYDSYRTTQYDSDRAEQLGLALTAVERYAVKNQNAIVSAQPVPGFAKPLAPTQQELTSGGFLPSSFRDNGKGGAIKLAIKVEPSGCAPAKCTMVVQALLAASIVNKGGQVDPATASSIAATVPGGAGWTNLPNDPTKIVRSQYVMPNPLGSVPAIVVAQKWIGSNQPSATVPPMSYETKTESDCAYGGSTTYQRTVTTDKWGNVTYGGWAYLYDSCAEPPAPEPVPEPPAPIPPPPPPPVTDPGAVSPPVIDKEEKPVVITPPPPKPPVITPPPPVECPESFFGCSDDGRWTVLTKFTYGPAPACKQSVTTVRFPLKDTGCTGYEVENRDGTTAGDVVQ